MGEWQTRGVGGGGEGTIRVHVGLWGLEAAKLVLKLVRVQLTMQRTIHEFMSSSFIFIQYIVPEP